MEPLKIGLDEICRVTGETKPTVHDAIRAGHLKTFLVGRRRFARPADVRAWVDFLQAQSDKGAPVCYRSREALGDARNKANGQTD